MSLPRRGPAGWTVHPGEILQQEFMRPLGVSGYRLAKALGVTPQAINDIVRLKRGISADMALRLARFFGISEQFWMGLQSAYELGEARKKNGAAVNRIQPHKGEAA